PVGQAGRRLAADAIDDRLAIKVFFIDDDGGDALGALEARVFAALHLGDEVSAILVLVDQVVAVLVPLGEVGAERRRHFFGGKPAVIVLVALLELGVGIRVESFGVGIRAWTRAHFVAAAKATLLLAEAAGTEASRAAWIEATWTEAAWSG